jgi:hypothetical protein
LSFFTTGHRGKVAGTLKVILDGLDLVAHGLAGSTQHNALVACSHTGLFAWHIAKQFDSEIIGFYSPLRALVTPNLIDTATYCTSTVLAMRDPEQQRVALVGAGIYAAMRAFDCVY